MAYDSYTVKLIMSNIGKVAKQPKLAVQNELGPLWWENIGKVAKQPKLAILNQFGPLW